MLAGRQGGRLIGSWTGRQANRQGRSYVGSVCYISRQVGRQAGRQVGRQDGRQVGRQAGGMEVGRVVNRPIVGLRRIFWFNTNGGLASGASRGVKPHQYIYQWDFAPLLAPLANPPFVLNQKIRRKPPIYLYTNVFAYLPTSLYLPTYLPTNLSTYLPTNLPNYLPPYLPAYLPTYLFFLFSVLYFEGGHERSEEHTSELQSHA